MSDGNGDKERIDMGGKEDVKEVTAAPVSPATSPKQLAKLIDIATDKDGKIYVNWPVDKKELCVTALAEAIKLVATYENKIVAPQTDFKTGLRNFLTGKKK